MEAIFGISGEANLTCRVSRANRVTLHWTLHATGMSLMIIGLIITIVNKNRIGKEHFVTPHAKLGLSAIILAILVGMFGILANNTRWLYPRIRPVLVKVGHAIGGIAIAILLLATVINGTYRPSFPGSETGTSLVFSSLFFAGLLVFAKPIVGAVSRSRVIFNSPKPNTTRSTWLTEILSRKYNDMHTCIYENCRGTPSISLPHYRGLSFVYRNQSRE